MQMAFKDTGHGGCGHVQHLQLGQAHPDHPLPTGADDLPSSAASSLGLFGSDQVSERFMFNPIWAPSPQILRRLGHGTHPP